MSIIPGIMNAAKTEAETAALEAFEHLRAKLDEVAVETAAGSARALAVVKTKLDEAELWLHAHIFRA